MIPTYIIKYEFCKAFFPAAKFFIMYTGQIYENGQCLFGIVNLFRKKAKLDSYSSYIKKPNWSKGKTQAIYFCYCEIWHILCIFTIMKEYNIWSIEILVFETDQCYCEVIPIRQLWNFLFILGTCKIWR